MTSVAHEISSAHLGYIWRLAAYLSDGPQLGSRLTKPSFRDIKDEGPNVCGRVACP